MDVPAVWSPLTRYPCPLPSCEWYHDEPDAPADLTGPAWNLTHEDVAAARVVFGAPRDLDPVADLCGAYALKRARAVEDELWRHFQTHPIAAWMREVLRLGAEFTKIGRQPWQLPSPTAPPSLRDFVLEVLRLQNELAALERLRADEAAAAIG